MKVILTALAIALLVTGCMVFPEEHEHRTVYHHPDDRNRDYRHDQDRGHWDRDRERWDRTDRRWRYAERD